MEGTNVALLVMGLVILVLVLLLIRPRPRPRPQHLLGGCAGTRWGCCPDGRTARSDPLGMNCGKAPKLIGGCAGTRWGCCPDGVTPKKYFMDTC